MATQKLKCLFCKQRDQNLIPKTNTRRWEVVVLACNPGAGRWRQEVPGTDCPSSLAYLVSSRIVRVCLKTQDVHMVPEV